MKLELKHIAPYLPYELKGVFTIYNTEQTVRSLGIIYINRELEYRHFKPILRPLSDLTKEIVNYNLDFSIREVNKLEKLIKTNDTQQYQNLEYSTIIFLCSNHYDFQNLIPKGLAIDINTLER